MQKKIQYFDFHQVEQSIILSDFSIQKVIGQSSSKLAGHLDFKTDEEAKKLYENSLVSPLSVTITIGKEIAKYEIRSVGRIGQTVSFSANKL